MHRNREATTDALVHSKHTDHHQARACSILQLTARPGRNLMGSSGAVRRCRPWQQISGSRPDVLTWTTVVERRQQHCPMPGKVNLASAWHHSMHVP